MNFVEKMIGHTVVYRYKQYFFFLGFTLFTWIIPWVVVDGNHFLLISFDHKELHLLFTKFSMQELYLMPFLIMILFIFIFGITVAGGRVFCGWGCPQTVFRVVYRDLIETKLLRMRKRISNKQKDPDYTKLSNKIKKPIAIGIWIVLAILASADLGWFFIPPEDFFDYVMHPASHPIFYGFFSVFVIFLVYDIVFLKEDFCIYVCPYSRVQSVLYDDDTLMAIYDEGRGGKIYDHDDKLVTNTKQLTENDECTTCEACVTVCPTHIDIRKGLQLECINCLGCVDACTKVMGNLGKPSLVQWSSVNVIEKKGKMKVLRQKTIGYIVLLVLLTIGVIWLGSGKEHMQLNINKENRLYKLSIKDGKKVIQNSYQFLFENTTDNDHEFYVEIVNSKNIVVNKPTKPFLIKAHESKKRTFYLQAEHMRRAMNGAASHVPVTVRAFAVDAKDKVFVLRDTIFIYPPKELFDSFK